MTFSKLRFAKFNKFITRSVFGGVPTHTDIIKFSNILLQLKTRRSGSETVCGFSTIFDSQRNYYVSEPKSQNAFCWIKILTLIKTKIKNQKCKIPQTVLERRTLCFSSYKNLKLKVKLRWVGARERKNKMTFFVSFILSEGNIFDIFVLSQCTVN